MTSGHFQLILLFSLSIFICLLEQTCGMNKFLKDAHFLTLAIVRTLYRQDSKGRLVPEQAKTVPDASKKT